jgi:hypothetical protein
LKTSIYGWRDGEKVRLSNGLTATIRWLGKREMQEVLNIFNKTSWPHSPQSRPERSWTAGEYVAAEINVRDNTVFLIYYHCPPKPNCDLCHLRMLLDGFGYGRGRKIEEPVGAKMFLRAADAVIYGGTCYTGRTEPQLKMREAYKNAIRKRMSLNAVPLLFG